MDLSIGTLVLDIQSVAEATFFDNDPDVNANQIEGTDGETGDSGASHARTARSGPKE